MKIDTKQALIDTALRSFNVLRTDLKEIMCMHSHTVQMDRSVMQWDDEAVCLSGELINRNIFSERVTDVIQLNYGLKVANEIWDEYADKLFYFKLNIILFNDTARMDISYITVPAVIRNRGLADHFFKWVASLAIELNIPMEVEMVDVSPDYNNDEGVTTHLCKKYNLIPRSDLFTDYGLYSA